MKFSRVAGLDLVSLGEVWAAFSPASAETILLNNESAAILETLVDGDLDMAAITKLLSRDCGLSEIELLPVIQAHCPRLIESGFLRPISGGAVDS